MGDQTNLFQYLMDQMGMGEGDRRDRLASGQIDKVDILVESGAWHFYLYHPQRLDWDTLWTFNRQLRRTFTAIAHVKVWWRFDEGAPAPGDIVAAWPGIVEDLGQDSPFLKACLENATIHLQEECLSVGLANAHCLEVIDHRYARLIQERFEQVDLGYVALSFYLDPENQMKELEEYQARIDRQDREIQNEAQAIQEKIAIQAQQVVAGPIEPIGKDIPPQVPTRMVDLEDNPMKQIIEGYVFFTDIRHLRNGGALLIMNITDYSSSVMVKILTGRRVTLEQISQFHKGDWLRLEGDMVPDNYTGELYFRPRSIRTGVKPVRQDTAAAGHKRVELHAHTQMSQLDATNSATDIIKQAAQWGHPAVAITDHGTVQSFPEAFKAAKDHQIKVIYGMEAYVVNDVESIAYNSAAIDLKTATYVVFDLETTGLSAVYDSIIEVGAVKMREGQVIDRFESFVNPGHGLSAFTTELTGITDADVADAPTFEPVLRRFWDFCKDSILVAHNASFDVSFINQAYKRLGLGETPLPVIDTLELSRLVNPEIRSHGLKVLTKRYNIQLEQHHRASFDSEATGYLLLKLLEQAHDQYQVVRHADLNRLQNHEEAYKHGRPFHATLLVKNQDGLKDLFRLVSESNIHYFYRVPRIPRSVLTKYRANLLIGTACSEGEVFTAMMQRGYEEAAKLVDFYDYIEIQPPAVYRPLIADQLIQSTAKLEEILRSMIALGEEHHIPVVATGNVHYLDEKDAIYREVIHSSLKANANRQLNLPMVHFRTTQEMLEAFAFLGPEKAYDLVVSQSQAIADKIDTIEVVKKDLYPPKIEGAEEDIRRMAYEKAKALYGDPLPEMVSARLEKELTSIIGNGFAVIYLIAQKLVSRSNADGYLVGSRGSVGSSLVATMTGITEVNPLAPHYYCQECHHSEFFTDGEVGSGYDLPDKPCPHCGQPMHKEGQDIPFETFLGFNGDKVPDIDLNFSGDYQARAHNHTKEIFGEDYVYRAGTIGTVAQKTALGYVRGYLEYKGDSLPTAERERLAYGIEGVKRTTGQHPGGIIVIPDDMDVYDFTPIQYPADDTSASWRTTHFDFHSIDNNVLKLDILGHDDPTMIRMLQDLTGLDPQAIPPVDAKVMGLFSGTEVMEVTPQQIFSDTGTLGIPEFGTNFVRGMVSETKPQTFAELLKISGLSHGTDVWLGNAQELIRKDIVPFAEVIGCRDDIMVTLIQYGLPEKLAFDIMERVRKGKGIPEDWQETMREHHVPEWYIESCLKIKYMFPKAHATAYVLMAMRIAYFKIYHPLAYYAAYFSVRAKEFDILAMHQGKEMVKRRIREINDKGFGATNKEVLLVTELEIANEMLERGYRFQMINLNKSDGRNFVIEGDSLIPPFRAIPGLGESVADQIIKARQEAAFLSKEDFQKRGKVSKTIMDYLEGQGVLKGLPDENQLSLFDF